MPVWHVSIAALWGPERRVQCVAHWNKALRTEAQRIALGLLRGVGEPVAIVSITDPPGAAIHVQAALTAAERERLPAGWLAVEAIDERGPMTVLERIKR